MSTLMRWAVDNDATPFPTGNLVKNKQEINNNMFWVVILHSVMGKSLADFLFRSRSFDQSLVNA